MTNKVKSGKMVNPHWQSGAKTKIFEGREKALYLFYQLWVKYGVRGRS